MIYYMKTFIIKLDEDEKHNRLIYLNSSLIQKVFNVAQNYKGVSK